jgi:hypothetical protein
MSKTVTVTYTVIFSGGSIFEVPDDVTTDADLGDFIAKTNDPLRLIQSASFDEIVVNSQSNVPG